LIRRSGIFSPARSLRTLSGPAVSKIPASPGYCEGLFRSIDSRCLVQNRCRDILDRVLDSRSMRYGTKTVVFDVRLGGF